MNRTRAADGLSERYPLAAAVIRRPMEGAKRKKLLAAIAAFQDEGHEPSIRELMQRTKLCDHLRWHAKRVAHIDALLKRLEADGHLRVEWAPKGQTGQDPKQRNRYEVVID